MPRLLALILMYFPPPSIHPSISLPLSLHPSTSQLSSFILFIYLLIISLLSSYLSLQQSESYDDANLHHVRDMYRIILILGTPFIHLTYIPSSPSTHLSLRCSFLFLSLLLLDCYSFHYFNIYLISCCWRGMPGDTVGPQPHPCLDQETEI